MDILSAEHFFNKIVYLDGILPFHPNFIRTIIRVKVILANNLKKLLNAMINLQTLHGKVVTYAIGYIVYLYLYKLFSYIAHSSCYSIYKNRHTRKHTHKHVVLLLYIEKRNTLSIITNHVSTKMNDIGSIVVVVLHRSSQYSKQQFSEEEEAAAPGKSIFQSISLLAVLSLRIIFPTRSTSGKYKEFSKSYHRIL